MPAPEPRRAAGDGPPPGPLPAALPPLGRALAGAFLLGLAASLRYPNLALAQAPALAALLRGQWARAVALGATVALSVLLVLGVTRALTGHFEPYGATRAGFDGATGYPGGPEAAQGRFESANGTNDVLTRERPHPRTIGYAAFYLLTGRHTGVLVYYPAAAMLALVVARRLLDRTVLPVALGSLAALAFYVFLQPENYFGGGTFVGNRYVLPMIAALAAAVPALPSLRSIVLCWGMALATGGSALASVVATRALDPMSQSHAHAGLFRLLPEESTAPEMDGFRDRYWAQSLVRFVDPHAAVDAASFRLRAGDPGADLLVVTPPASGPLHFLVGAAVPSIELRIAEMGWTRTFPIGPHPGGARSVVAWRPLPAWRRHPFWWEPRDAIYAARVLRVSARAAGSGEEVTLRYLGDGSVLRATLAREVVDAELALPAAGGAPASARITVRNTSDFAWSGDAVLPVQVAARVTAAGEEAGAFARHPLPGAVPVGSTVVLDVPLAWPRAAGAVHVEIDLVLEEVAFFADRNAGERLLDRLVEAPAAADGGVRPTGPAGASGGR